MPNKISSDFCVTDKLREWALKKYGYYDLPDCFISDFKAHFEAKGTKYTDWDKTLQNWITSTSPSGKFYNANIWESALNKCKQKMKKESIKVPLPEIKRPPKPVNRELARNEIKKMRLGL